MYHDSDAFEEIAITTSGADPSVQSGRIRISFVTERGGNEFVCLPNLDSRCSAVRRR